MSESDRRRAERVLLASPLPGKVDDQEVKIHEIGLVGSLIEHSRALVPDTALTLTFFWDDEKLEIPARVARCELQTLLSEKAGAMIFHSGLEFTEESGKAANMLRRMISSYVSRTLEELKRNARGGVDDSLVPFLKLDASNRKRPDAGGQASDRVYLRCRFGGGVWEKTESLNPRQPPDGFTVLASHPKDELELLCRTYESADPQTRKLLRVCSELSLRG